MWLASLVRGLSHLSTRTKPAANTVRNQSMGRIVSSGGEFRRLCVAPFRSNYSGTRSKRFSSLGTSTTRLQSSTTTLEDSSASSPPQLSPLDENFFLHQVEATISKVFESQTGNSPGGVEILTLPKAQREAFGVATNIDKRLRSLRKNNDCPRCWMQRYHCICDDCGPVVVHNSNNSNSSETKDSDTTQALGRLKRIFLVVHHKEIGLKVDTAKLILAAFPFQCELVVGGIGPEYQQSMKTLLESIQDSKRTSLLLFPDETAETLEEIVAKTKIQSSESLRDSSTHQNNNSNGDHDDDNDDDTEYDLIVLDGTWAQARKLHSRYFPPSNTTSSLQRVKLSEASVELLHEGSIESGHQLRRHEIPWRQVGTFEAFRLFLRDWSREFPSAGKDSTDTTTDTAPLELWEQIESYQRIANEAALKELGPPRK